MIDLMEKAKYDYEEDEFQFVGLANSKEIQANLERDKNYIKSQQKVQFSIIKKIYQELDLIIKEAKKSDYFSNCSSNTIAQKGHDFQHHKSEYEFKDLMQNSNTLKLLYQTSNSSISADSYSLNMLTKFTNLSFKMRKLSF
ncbi:hypothetical protein OXYTRIMIC_674 [Oxytricha trifallax]|uniref:Uncharacterized protein n=1 Tax=Oxytricha trifallax TaxID=1172189 RepID=A0A073IBP1_9SPIT|nr:hypothetical protein OXYTRIMIC_674 [Oxytricha trifallax]